MRRRYLIILFCSFAVHLNAQNYKLSDDPKQFPQDLMNLTGGTAEGTVDTPYSGFEQSWNKLSAGQQTTLMNTARQMAQLKLKKPLFQKFVRVVMDAQSSSISAFDPLLTTLNSAAENQDRRSIANLLTTVDTYLSSQALFKTSYNSLYAQGGTLTFEYATASTVTEVEETVERLKV